jgi:hypothetical protein
MGIAMAHDVSSNIAGFVDVRFLGNVTDSDRASAMDDAAAALLSAGYTRLLADFSIAAGLERRRLVEDVFEGLSNESHCRIALVIPLGALHTRLPMGAHIRLFSTRESALSWLCGPSNHRAHHWRC